MKKKRENIIYTLVIVAILIAIGVYKKNLREKNKVLNKKGSVTVGKVIDVGFPGRVTTSGYSNNYTYFVENVQYEGSSLSDEKYSVDSYFEVTFIPETPEKSRMEFDKPVHPDDVCTYFESKCPF